MARAIEFFKETLYSACSVDISPVVSKVDKSICSKKYFVKLIICQRLNALAYLSFYSIPV